MIPAILFFLVLIAPPLFFAVWQKRRFEETIALTTGGLILFMYVLGIIGLLKMSVYLILGMTLVLLGLSACLVFRKKDVRRTLAPFFTPTGLAFFLLFLFLIYTHYDRLVNGTSLPTGVTLSRLCAILTTFPPVRCPTRFFRTTFQGSPSSNISSKRLP